MVNLEIGGIPFCVDHKYDIFDKWVCCGHETKRDPLFVVSATREEIAREREWFCGRFTEAQCESNVLYRKVSYALPRYDAFLLHAAVTAMDGEAYAFTAASGTGKSTHVSYWLRAFGARAYILNGDKPVLKWSDGRFYACGTPWRGKERLGTADCLPLKAVYVLERAQENRISPATADEVIERLVVQTLFSQEADLAGKQLDLLDRLTECVPIYRLACNMTEEAARVAYEGAKGDLRRQSNGDRCRRA